MVPTRRHAARCCSATAFATCGRWSHGVDTAAVPVPGPAAHVCRWTLPRPVFLYVGRVSYEKNLEAFLALDLPGTKLVCGAGPVLERAASRAIPQVHWRGLLPRDELAGVYGAADAVRLPQPQRNLRPGDARGHGLRHAGGRLSGGRAAGRAGPQREDGRQAGRRACTRTCGRPATARWRCRATRRGCGPGFQLGARPPLFAATWSPVPHGGARVPRSDCHSLSRRRHNVTARHQLSHDPIDASHRRTLPPPRRRHGAASSTATTASSPSTSGCSTGRSGPTCRCWSGCATCASSRPTSTNSSRCAPRRT